MATAGGSHSPRHGVTPWVTAWVVVVAGFLAASPSARAIILCKGRQGLLRVREACKPTETAVSPADIVAPLFYTRVNSKAASYDNECLAVDVRCEGTDLLLSCEPTESAG